MNRVADPIGASRLPDIVLCGRRDGGCARKWAVVERGGAEGTPASRAASARRFDGACR